MAMSKQIVLIMAVIMLAMGCAASTPQVQMSDEIRLTGGGSKTIFIETTNNSAAPLDDLGRLLSSRFVQQGFQVVGDVQAAHYYLQLDVVDFGVYTQQSQPPVVPHLGVGVGTGWGWPVGIGVGVGIGTILSPLFSSQENQYVISAHVRIEEQGAHGPILHESSLVSVASQSDTSFSKGLALTRDAMLDQVMKLFDSDSGS